MAKDLFADLIPKKRVDTVKDSFSDLIPGTAKQEAGPVIEPRAAIREARGLLPTREEIPEMIGSLGGTLAKRTLPGMALSGALSAAGRAFTERGKIIPGIAAAIAARGTPSEEEALRQAIEPLKSVGMAGLRGAALEPFGRAIGAVGKKVFGPTSPEILEQIQKARAAGIEPPLSTITKSQTIQAMEAMSRAAPFAGAKIEARKEAALKGFEEMAERVGAKIGPEKPAAFIRENAEQSLDLFKKSFRKTKDELYQANKALQDLPVEPEETIKTIDFIIEKRQSVTRPKELDLLSRLKQDFIPKSKTGQLKFREVTANMRNITEQEELFSKEFRTGISRDFELVKQALSRDLDRTASNFDPVLAEQLKEADRFFAQGAAKLKDKWFRALQTTARREPSQLFKVAIPQKNPELVSFSREILGDSFNDVRRQWFDNIFNSSFIEVEGKRIFSPAKLISNMNRYNDKVMAELFSDSSELLTQIATLKDVARLLGRGKGITEGSRTAILLQVVGPLYAGLGGSIAALVGGQSPLPALGAGVAAGVGAVGAQEILGRTVANPVFSRFIERGFPMGRAITTGLGVAARPGLSEILQRVSE